MLPWDAIDTALLDMDGVLLDRHFDDGFWQVLVPARYAAQRGLADDAARDELRARYQAHEGTLNWTDVDFWSRELGLDIPALKAQAAGGIAYLPHAECFLEALGRRGTRRVLVTNAHPETVRVKAGKLGFPDLLDAAVSAFDLNVGKEDPAFWERLMARVPFDPARTVLVEDSAPNLASAAAFGIAHLVHVRHPNTRGPAAPDAGFPSVAGVRDLVPGLTPPTRGPGTRTACECSAPGPGSPPG
jgi:HAD superfamily hydrolase (TIGR01509 family)